MKLYILTSEELPVFCADDHKLIFKLNDIGISTEIIIWDKENVPNGSTVLIRTIWDYALKEKQFRKLLSDFKARKINCINPIKTLEWNMDKSYLCELYDKGASVVPTYIASSFCKEDLNKSEISFPLVVKPLVGASGVDTYLLEDSSSLVDISNLYEREVIIQPFMKGIKSEGEISFLYFGGKFSHCVLKVAKDSEFRVQDDHGGSVYEYKPTSDELEEVQKILQHVEYQWEYARVDVVRECRKLYLMELELIEPELFFRFSNNGETLLGEALSSAISKT